MSEVVTVNGESFVWEEITGKGRCLVPAPKVTLWSLQGKVLRLKRNNELCLVRRISENEASLVPLFGRTTWNSKRSGRDAALNAENYEVVGDFEDVFSLRGEKEYAYIVQVKAARLLAAPKTRVFLGSQDAPEEIKKFFGECHCVPLISDQYHVLADQGEFLVTQVKVSE